MAITINEQPSTSYLYPAHNPIQYLVSSTNYTQANFKMYAYIHLDPSGANTLVATRRLVPTPGTSRVLFDVGSVVRDYIDENIDNIKDASTGIKDETDVCKYFKIAFREYYGTPPAFGAASGIVSGDVVGVYNGAFKYTERFDTNIDGDTSYLNWRVLHDSTTSNDTANPFLTAFNNVYAGSWSSGRPQTLTAGMNWLPIDYDQLVNLRYRFGTGGTEDAATIILYDSALGYDSSDAIEFNTTTKTANAIFSLNAGIQELDATGGLTLTFDNTKEYMVVRLGAAATQTSCGLMYKIDWNPCTKYERYEIHWLNRGGGYDSFMFKGRSYKSEETDRVTYRKTLHKFNDSTPAITNLLHETSIGSHYVGVKEKYKLNTMPINGWMADGFKDLFSSPSVYWRHADLGFIQIVPEGSMYEIKNSVGDKVFNIELSFTIDHGNIRQRS